MKLIGDVSYSQIYKPVSGDGGISDSSIDAKLDLSESYISDDSIFKGEAIKLERTSVNNSEVTGPANITDSTLTSGKFTGTIDDQVCNVECPED